MAINSFAGSMVLNVFVSTPRLHVCDSAFLALLQAGPLSSECEKDGKIVCHRGKIQGEQGANCTCLVVLRACLYSIASFSGF